MYVFDSLVLAGNVVMLLHRVESLLVVEKRDIGGHVMPFSFCWLMWPVVEYFLL